MFYNGMFKESCDNTEQTKINKTMKKKIEEIKEAIYNCGDEYAENREQVIRAVNLLEELEKQFSLNVVSHRRELLTTVRERNAFNDGYSLGCKTTRKKYEK